MSVGELLAIVQGRDPFAYVAVDFEIRNYVIPEVTISVDDALVISWEESK